MIRHIIFLLLGLAAAAQGKGPCYRECYNMKSSYPIGSAWPFKNNCFEIYCEKDESGCANWSPNGKMNPDCKQCYVHNDPHLHTFDGHNYDYHNPCNHSLAQAHYGPTAGTQNPDFGVFSEFEMCSTSVSCLDSVVFKDSEHTIITVDYATLISETPFMINSGPQYGGYSSGIVQSSVSNYHPVYYWQNSGCWQFQGTHLATAVCPGSVRIWATTNYHNQLAGLCGLFNGNVDDDFLWRNGFEENPPSDWPLSSPFGLTWQTDVQPNKKQCPIKKISAEDKKEKCTDEKNNKELCEQAIKEAQTRAVIKLRDQEQYDITINNCVFDMCANPINVQIWYTFYVDETVRTLKYAKGINH